MDNTKKNSQGKTTKQVRFTARGASFTSAEGAAAGSSLFNSITEGTSASTPEKASTHKKNAQKYKEAQTPGTALSMKEDLSFQEGFKTLITFFDIETIKKAPYAKNDTEESRADFSTLKSDFFDAARSFIDTQIENKAYTTGIFLLNKVSPKTFSYEDYTTFNPSNLESLLNAIQSIQQLIKSIEPKPTSSDLHKTKIHSLLLLEEGLTAMGVELIIKPYTVSLTDAERCMRIETPVTTEIHTSTPKKSIASSTLKSPTAMTPRTEKVAEAEASFEKRVNSLFELYKPEATYQFYLRNQTMAKDNLDSQLSRMKDDAQALFDRLLKELIKDEFNRRFGDVGTQACIIRGKYFPKGESNTAFTTDGFLLLLLSLQKVSETIASIDPKEIGSLRKTRKNILSNLSSGLKAIGLEGLLEIDDTYLSSEPSLTSGPK